MDINLDNFIPGKLAGEIFTLEMDEDLLADISSNVSDNYTLDVHDFNLEEWDRNMRKRGFKCEDVMEYVVETFQWKRSLESRYQPELPEVLPHRVGTLVARILAAEHRGMLTFLSSPQHVALTCFVMLIRPWYTCDCQSKILDKSPLDLFVCFNIV